MKNNDIELPLQVRGMSFKNFIQKNDIIKLLAEGRKVITIDPKHEYTQVDKKF